MNIKGKRVYKNDRRIQEQWGFTKQMNDLLTQAVYDFMPTHTEPYPKDLIIDGEVLPIAKELEA